MRFANFVLHRIYFHSRGSGKHEISGSLWKGTEINQEDLPHPRWTFQHDRKASGINAYSCHRSSVSNMSQVIGGDLREKKRLILAPCFQQRSVHISSKKEVILDQDG